MKFFLQQETDFIYLDQLLKAAGIFEDYLDIRSVIESGRVRVNGDFTRQRRKMVRAGDTVRYREHYIQVLPSSARPGQEPERETFEHIVHGKGPQKWIEKPIRLKRRKPQE